MGCLIPLSFMCGIIAGILIWRGGELSKRTEEVEARLRGALEKERSNPVEGDDRAGPSIDNERDDEPTREKPKVHTGGRGSSDAIKDTSFDANRDHEFGPQNKQGDREGWLVSESPTSQTSLHVEASTPDVPHHETSQLVSRI